MTIRELAGKLGKRATYHPPCGGITFEVEVEDVKEQWGRVRYLVRPVAGSGATWTEAITEKP